MNIDIYSHKKCSTCRNFINQIKDICDKSDQLNVIDITESPPSKDQILSAMQEYDSKRKVINTSGKVYKEIGLKDKVDEMSHSELAEILAKNGMLVKRPFTCVSDGSSKKYCAGNDLDQFKKITSY